MIKRFALPDAAGNIVAFYSDDVCPSPPAGVVSISDDQWQACLKQPGRWVIANGAFVQSATWAMPSPIPPWLASRQGAYPSIQVQLDTLYHGGLDAWHASIKAIKDQFPKA